MKTYVIMKYVAPEQSTQHATDIYEFTLDPGMPIPTANQVVTLPVKRPEGFGEQQKDYRVVEVRHTFSGFVPNLSQHNVDIFVTDIDE